MLEFDDTPPAADSSEHAAARLRMVENQLRVRGIQDERLLAAFARVPRHLFLPASLDRHAHDDRALPLGNGQTISQPFMVARMLELAAPAPGDRALEVGTGFGYQAALLAELTGVEVFTLERVGDLARTARERLALAGRDNVTVLHRDGSQGLPEHAPFDVIVVAAGAPRIPAPLEEQLADGGRLVIPVGDGFWMEVAVVRRRGHQRQETRGEPCLFVPLLDGVTEA